MSIRDNREEVKTIEEELKVRFKEAKEKFRKKLEWKIQQKNLREVWRGMRNITGFRTNNKRGIGVSADRAQYLICFQWICHCRALSSPL